MKIIFALFVAFYSSIGLAQQFGPSCRKLNFGVIVNNDHYTIYRSSKLGEEGLRDLKKHLEDENLPFPKTIIYMNKTGYGFPWYYALEEYKQSLLGSFKFIHSFSEERTYIDGENPYNPTDDIDSRLILGHEARRYFSLRDDGIDGGIDAVMRVLSIMLNPENQPVLIHCLGGFHRTGMMAMVIRYLQGGFWVDGPKVEVKGMSLNPAQYEYSRYNPLFFRVKNIEFIEAFSQDRRFLDLRDRYQGELQD